MKLKHNLNIFLKNTEFWKVPFYFLLLLRNLSKFLNLKKKLAVEFFKISESLYALKFCNVSQPNTLNSLLCHQQNHITPPSTPKKQSIIKLYGMHYLAPRYSGLKIEKKTGLNFVFSVLFLFTNKKPGWVCIEISAQKPVKEKFLKKKKKKSHMTIAHRF